LFLRFIMWSLLGSLRSISIFLCRVSLLAPEDEISVFLLSSKGLQ
jgi:hypothetical protein